MGQSPEEIRADIEVRRANLAGTADDLQDRLSPRHIASRQAERMRSGARQRWSSARERLMGSPEWGTTAGTWATERTAAAIPPSAEPPRGGLAEQVGQAPQAVGQAAQGNPLAAGLVAFAVGMLVGASAPASQIERRAAGAIAAPLDTVVSHVQEAAAEVGSAAQGDAQEAVEQVRDAAAEAARTLTEEGRSSAGEVASQAKAARDQVSDQTSS